MSRRRTRSVKTSEICRISVKEQQEPISQGARGSETQIYLILLIITDLVRLRLTAALRCPFKVYITQTTAIRGCSLRSYPRLLKGYPFRVCSFVKYVLVKVKKQLGIFFSNNKTITWDEFHLKTTWNNMKQHCSPSAHSSL